MINNNRVGIHKRSGLIGHLELLIDGYITEGIDVKEIQSSNFGQKFYSVFSKDFTGSRKITSLGITEFTKANILLFIFNSWTEIGIFAINVQLNIGEKNKRSFLTFELLADLLLWNRQYTFIDYLQEFENLLNLGEIGKIVSKNVGEIIKVEIETTLENKTILELIENNLEKVIEIHYRTLDKLDSVYYSNSILTSFNFPEKVKISCEQYLQYFAQFLQDLGIEVTSHIKEEAGKVLFSVTPTDDVEALDKIREALAIYLNLPSSPIVYDESFASMRLQAEIERLQSSQRIAEMEFRVAHKAIESQDKIILQQSILLEQQAKVIEKITNKSVMIDSAENKEELMKIYEGAEFSHSKWLFELTGIKLNPLKVIETAVKNTLGKGDEIIELGLNKND